MERYIEELIEIYRKNTLKSDEELESLKSLLRNVHRDGFIAGEESIIMNSIFLNPHGFNLYSLATQKFTTYSLIELLV